MVAEKQYAKLKEELLKRGEPIELLRIPYVKGRLHTMLKEFVVDLVFTKQAVCFQLRAEYWNLWGIFGSVGGFIGGFIVLGLLYVPLGFTLAIAGGITVFAVTGEEAGFGVGAFVGVILSLLLTTWTIVRIGRRSKKRAMNALSESKKRDLTGLDPLVLVMWCNKIDIHYEENDHTLQFVNKRTSIVEAEVNFPMEMWRQHGTKIQACLEDVEK